MEDRAATPISSASLLAHVLDDIYDFYASGARNYRDIPEATRLVILSRLCLTDLTWIEKDWTRSGDKLNSDIVKDAICAQLTSLALSQASPLYRMDDYEFRVNKLLECMAEAAENHFEPIINKSFAALDSIPSYLDKVLHEGDDNDEK